jgi:hypothetical protein
MYSGFNGMDLKQILSFWKAQKADIPADFRFILITALNENWGTLSSYIPGR